MIVLFFHINFSDIYFFNSVRCEKSKQPPLTHSHTMTPFDAPGKQAF